MRLILHWLLSAFALMAVARLVRGFSVSGLGAALAAALVIGLLNATVGFVAKLLTLPLTILTLGLFLFVINAVVILLASHLTPGFRVSGLGPALWGSLWLSLLGVVVRAVTERG